MDPSVRPPESASSRSGGSGLTLRETASALRRRWLLFLGLVGGVVALVMTVTLLIPPVYESEASVRARPDRTEGIGGRLGGMMGDVEDAIPMGLSLPGLGGDADVQTQIGILGSRLVLEGVADSLSLHVSLVRPWREQRSDVLHVLEAGEDAPRGMYTLRRRGDGTYRMRAWQTREPVELPDRVTIGEPFRVGPMTLVLEPGLADDPPRTVWFQVQPFRRMIRKLRRDVRIQREDAGSRLVEIKYRHQDPRLAQAFVNGVVDRFLEYSEEFNKSDSGREAEILAGQVASYSRELAEAEARLQAFQESRRLIHPEEQAIAQVERIAEVAVARDAMEVEREALQTLLRSVENRVPLGSPPTPYRQLATFPSFITNQSVQELLRNLTALESTRADLLVRRTEQNIDVRMVQDRIREIEEQLHAMAVDYLESLDTQLASAGATLERFGVEVERMPAVEIEYARLYRERKLLSEVYLHLQARLTEARVREATEDARIRAVDRGVIEDRPAFPRPAISLVLSLVLGLMVGLFGVVAVETGSPNVRSRDDAEGAAGVPLLGTIPDHAQRGGRSRRRGVGSDRLITREDPWHDASEEFRALALTLLAGDPAPRVILVASPGPGEGRSTVAANLAVAFAQQGLRAAFIDADLRAGSAPALFEVPNRPGWVPAVLAAAPEVEAVREVDLGGSGGSLSVFPAGQATAHPLEILASEKVRSFVSRTGDAYDAVVIDTPALESGHDAVVLAPLADAVLLVARSDGTPWEALRHAADALRRAGGRLAGVVLTDRESTRFRWPRFRWTRGRATRNARG